MNLFDPAGHRLDLAADERAAFLDAAKSAPREVRTFCHVLHDTGCRGPLHLDVRRESGSH
jgi:hypothetical protein